MSATIDMPAEIRSLAAMTVEQLQQRYVDLFGERSRTPHRQYLFRKIAWHLQARISGGLSEETRQVALGIAREAELRTRIAQNASRRRGGIPLDRTVTTSIAQTHDARLPMPGALLMKEFKGRTIVVKVLDEGFEYEDQRFSSLSAIAREISGTKWNGFNFFGLNKEASIVQR
ncbi:MAG: DUF2924 domain-containing protein [Acidobacteria bacterium]|nr:DUF2924 domain-containing protein [Acidobacteriota bacterium]